MPLNNDKMDLNEQSKFYDKHWSSLNYFNTLKIRRASKILDLMIPAMKKSKELHILDFGCGDGRFSSMLGFIGKTDGVDLSVEAVAISNQRFPHVNYISGDVNTIQLNPDYYDIIISQEVIEHLEDQETYIKQCAKFLKKGGILILTTPNKDVFDHHPGGNWSRQPIENILTYDQIKNLIAKHLTIQQHTSEILGFGNMGSYKFINNQYFFGVLKRLGLANIYDQFRRNRGYGLHSIVVAEKK
ncbi:MAG: methyltransferase domain-containing protein [Bacteroidetes bacterium]|nr:methyltransferase domain-containing protein [Bacteroidota bacterium]